jgi:hypothetical protein
MIVSLLTAALLKIALELVILLKTQIITRFRAADTRHAKLAAAGSLWVVAAGSKLVVLELVDVVFGDAVSLGGFISVTLLVVALLVSRAAVRRLLSDTRLRPDRNEIGMPNDIADARLRVHIEIMRRIPQPASRGRGGFDVGVRARRAVAWRSRASATPILCLGRAWPPVVWMAQLAVARRCLASRRMSLRSSQPANRMSATRTAMAGTVRVSQACGTDW